MISIVTYDQCSEGVLDVEKFFSRASDRDDDDEGAVQCKENLVRFSIVRCRCC
jgi:hypothetical protein